MPGSRRKSASTQGHTYVIDQSYRVVYLDRAARRVFPGGRVGELCYECFRGQSEPCKDCPWNAESNEHATQSVIYSARTGSWYEITCLELDWFNEGPCVLFSGHPVDEHSRSLFTSLSEPSSYDELFELNLTDDAYKILYHEPGKFTTPPLEGRISDMFPDVLPCVLGFRHVARPHRTSRRRTARRVPQAPRIGGMELDVADRGTRQARRKRRARGHVLHRGHRRRDAATHGSGRTLANPAIARTRPADRPVQCGYVLRQSRTPGSRHARHRVRCSVHRHRALQNIQRVAWARSRRRHLARHRLAYRGDRP